MADNLPPFCAVVTKSGNLNFLELSGPGQACNGTDLPSYIREALNLATCSEIMTQFPLIFKLGTVS